MPMPIPRPSGRSEPGAAATLLACAVGAGATSGLAAAIFAIGVVDVVGVLSVVVGTAVGFASATCVRWRKVRAPVLAACIAILGALAGRTVIHVAEYEVFRWKAENRLRAEHPGTDAASLLDELLVRDTGRSGWAGFVRDRAKSGVTIERTGPALQLAGVAVYLLWLAELVAAAVVAAWCAAEAASAPFCEHCQRWFAPPAGARQGRG